MFNRGCRCEFIPFWQSTNGDRIAEPLLDVGPAYFYAFASTAWVCLWAMRKARARWPDLGNLALGLVAYLGVWTSFSLLDVFATRVLHFDAWPGALRSAKMLALLRVLALIGFCNVCNLAYTTTMGVHALDTDPWPQMPSWLANEQCGTITGLSCVAID